MARLAYTVLGGLGAQIDSEPAELGTRKQRAVLAQLLLARGDSVSVDRLIDGIWGPTPPDRAEVSVQAYVSGLRKALEPGRRPRTPSTVLLTRGTGYALIADDADVDIRVLYAAIVSAHERHRSGELATAARDLRTALADYRPLLPEFEGLAFRDEAAVHLERTIAEAREFSYELRLALGEHRALVPELEQAVRHAPLDEGLWVLLATARYRLGRQSEALAAIADARRILADEIGVDPGPRLRELERDILDHSPRLQGPTHNTVEVSSVDVAGVEVDRPANRETNSPHANADTATAAPPARADDEAALIGRSDELAVLHRAVLTSVQGPGGIVVVEGDAGAGKSALLGEAARRAAASAHLKVLWGRCIEDAAAPSMWPWVQILGAVLPDLTTDDRDALLDNDLGRMVTQGSTVIPPPREMPDAAARFRFYDQAADMLARVAHGHLLIIVLDDLQWADGASLELFAHMAARRTAGVTFFTSVRTRTQRAAVADALAAVSRLPEHRRIEVGPLSDDDISALVRRETREWPASGTVATIARRTRGNAFFVRELARILADRGAIDDGAVPAGVRDVVRDRLGPLAAATVALLEVAALIGSRVDLSLLASAAGMPTDEMLETLESAYAAGLISTAPDDPFTVEFDHDLIREAIAGRMSTARAYRIHLAIADQLENSTTSTAVSQRATHLWAAGPLADRSRTARTLLDAGRIALRSYDFDAAGRRLTGAAQLARTTGDDGLELQSITTLLDSEVARNGYFAADRELLRRARELGERASDDALLARLDYARFAAHSQLAEIGPARRYAEALAERARRSDQPVVQHLGMQAAAIDLFDRGHIGDAHRLLEAHAPIDGSVDGVQTDQLMIGRGFRAVAATLHVGPSYGRELFEQIDIGPDDPMSHLGTAIFAATAGALVGDADWVGEVGERMVGSSGHSALEYLRTGGERIYWWARAVSGSPDKAFDHIARLHDPRGEHRTGTGLWWSLYAEALVIAGRFEHVPALLRQAQDFAERTGQRYPDAHRLLVCAEFQNATDLPAATVHDTLREARRVAIRQQATTLCARIDAFAMDHGYWPDVTDTAL
ncbi:AAA family ATPase [Gordonia sp. HNM0687]|uniref:AAA family ATPase n=1 Tax=Gordonia mangrovi TaxID=2665643 RepID=A0A6L7GX07_9ACTN|nr:BTAD domain-containing putative transcriptional regulator [Gordonia mangrovi]MXP24047.1 AAA family ATPase [Gordonia mangrovi]UVF78147.1 AAA family ATPase [Gordonia mangrovi]